jgi:hypothetical protein
MLTDQDDHNTTGLSISRPGLSNKRSAFLALQLSRMGNQHDQLTIHGNGPARLHSTPVLRVESASPLPTSPVNHPHASPTPPSPQPDRQFSFEPNAGDVLTVRSPTRSPHSPQAPVFRLLTEHRTSPIPGDDRSTTSHQLRPASVIPLRPSPVSSASARPAAQDSDLLPIVEAYQHQHTRSRSAEWSSKWRKMLRK